MLSQIYNVDFLFWAVIEVKGIFFISLKYSAFGDLYIVFFMSSWANQIKG